MPLPVPTLDHVVVNVGIRMDEAAARWRRLGFTLTPRGTHTLGSINHLAMFGTDYLELIGAPADGPRLDVLDWPDGLNGLVFGTEDAAATHAAMALADVPCGKPQEFSRPVELPGGARDASFRTARLPNDTTQAGRLYFCHHLTRDLVWRDEWRRHANGAVGVVGMVIAAADPQRLGALFRRMFGADAVVAIHGGLRLLLGLSSADIVVPAELARRFGAAAPTPDARAEYMAVLVLRTASLASTRAALRQGGIPGVIESGGQIQVPATEATGAGLVFQP